MATFRNCQRRSWNPSKFPSFVDEGNILRAPVHRQEQTPEFMGTSTRPWRAVVAYRAHVHQEQSIVNNSTSMLQTSLVRGSNPSPNPDTDPVRRDLCS